MKKSAKIAKFILSLGGIGNVSHAPGSVGSVFSVLVIFSGFWWGHEKLHFDLFLAVYLWTLIFLLFGGKYIILLAIKKPPYDQKWIVLDEFLGIQISLLPFFVLPESSFVWWILALLVFRFFDILKPLGIKNIDQKNTPESVFYDDALAGIYTMLVILIAKFMVDS